MNTKKKSYIIPVIIVILLVQLACAWPFDWGSGSDSGQPTPAAEAPSSAGGDRPNAGGKPPGHGAQGPQAPPASGSPGSGSQAPTSPQGSNPTPQGPVPTPQGQAGCTNRYALGGSVNVSQGQEFETGEAFEVIWSLKNVGTCTWTSDYALKHTHGDTLGAIGQVPLNTQAAPGDTIQVSVQMSAPANTGSYFSIWKMVGPGGEAFDQGASLKVAIQVVQGGSGNNSGLTPMPMPGDLLFGWLSSGDGETLTTSKCYDLVSGSKVACSDPDAGFRYNYAQGQGANIVPLNGLEFSGSLADRSDEDTCKSQNYYGLTLQLALPASSSTGKYYCLRLDVDGDTAYGWLKPTDFNGGGITFDYVIYEPDSSPVLTPVEVIPDLGLFTLVSGDQVTILDEQCYDLTAGGMVSCGNSSASFRYNHNSYYGGILEPRLSLDFSNTMTSKPDRATCQSEAYPHEAPVVFTTNPPGIYACFKTQYGGDTVYGWIHPTYFNNSGLTFDFVTYNP